MLVITPSKTYYKDGEDNNVVLFHNSMPIEYHEIKADYETGIKYIDQSYNVIDKIIQSEKFVCNHLYSDIYLSWHDMPYNSTWIPSLFLYECINFFEDVFVDYTKFKDSITCFFAMNKRRENRLLISSWFSKHGSNINYDYTQGWAPTYNDSILLSELTRCTNFGHLSTFLEKKFISYKGQPSTNNFNLPNGITHNYEGHKSLWNNVLGNKFCSSTFAIVNEPVFWEKAVMPTEKYLMVLYGCCFPIFCGGYKIAIGLSNIGFDVFDDIIDHSYQYEEHPTNRILRALELNRDLLEDSIIKKQDYMDRHLKNLKLVREKFIKFQKQFNINEHINNKDLHELSYFDVLARKIVNLI